MGSLGVTGRGEVGRRERLEMARNLFRDVGRKKKKRLMENVSFCCSKGITNLKKKIEKSRRRI